MESKTWKYIENSFEVNTRSSRSKMDKLVQDHDGKLTTAAAKTGADPRLVALAGAWVAPKGAWDDAYANWKNAKANYGGSTLSFEQLLKVLQAKPSPDSESKIEEWDRRIRGEAPKGSALYKTLLPQGRTPFNSGARDQIVNAVKLLGERLAAQTGNANLVTLGGEVTAFYQQLNAARSTQQGMEGDTDIDATTIENSRKTIATVLYGNLGMLMNIYQATPEMVAGFFDLGTLRQAAPAPGHGGLPPPTPGTPGT